MGHLPPQESSAYGSWLYPSCPARFEYPGTLHSGWHWEDSAHGLVPRIVCHCSHLCRNLGIPRFFSSSSFDSGLSYLACVCSTLRFRLIATWSSHGAFHLNCASRVHSSCIASSTTPVLHNSQVSRPRPRPVLPGLLRYSRPTSPIPQPLSLPAPPPPRSSRALTGPLPILRLKLEPHTSCGASVQVHPPEQGLVSLRPLPPNGPAPRSADCLVAG